MMDGKAFWILLAVLIVTSGIFAYPLISGTIKVDNCLDAGGRWNKITGMCDFMPEPPLR